MRDVSIFSGLSFLKPECHDKDRYPLNTGRKSNVHKAFRGYPEHLLNLLCTFSLRPVSRGSFQHSNQTIIMTYNNLGR